MPYISREKRLAYAKNWRDINRPNEKTREYRKLYMRAYRQGIKKRDVTPTNPKETKRQAAARHRQRYPDYFKKYKLQRYGLSVDAYNSLLEEQSGVCAICCRPETRVTAGTTISSLPVDHCHETGVVRGLLCHNCNTAIGLMEDDPDRLRKAIVYLEKEREINGC